MMSFTRLESKDVEETPVVEVRGAMTDPPLQLSTLAPLQADEPADEASTAETDVDGLGKEPEGELELDDGEEGTSLIREEEDIDEHGVVREYEVALKYVGFGLFHVILVAVNGLALSSDAVEVLSISFVLPIIRERDEFDLEDWQNAFLSSIIFVGMLFGGYLWGGLSDLTGRRHTILMSLSVNGLFGFVSAFAPNYWSFVLFRFISGVGVGGSLPVIFSYMSEFIRNKYRGPYLGIQSTFWMVGSLLCGAFAWIIIPRHNIHASLGAITITSWRVFIMISALPSVLGAVFYLFLPESPRYLLEVGKDARAMKALTLAYRLNHLHRDSPPFPVKTVLLKESSAGVWRRSLTNSRRRPLDCGRNFLSNFMEILRRTYELFHFDLLRRTVLLLIVLFCLSFGSYGVTLWYPSYVKQINDQKDDDRFDKFCDRNVTSSDVSLSLLDSLCDCTQTTFHGSAIGGVLVEDWVISARFIGTSFNRTHFSNVLFKDCEFVNCAMDGVALHSAHFVNSRLTGLSLSDATIQESRFCGVHGEKFSIRNVTMEDVLVNGREAENSTVFVSLLNTSVGCSNGKVKKIEESVDVDCREIDDDDRVYRDNFIIAASALPGNIVSAIAVYFFRRNYWLAFSLLTSTASVFLLYIFHSELAVVAILSLFNALSTPAWNDSSLLTMELYPTHLRSTAMGVLLITARIGAILGTNIFGQFVYVNPNIPILTVVAVLGLGGATAVFLPKTTRKTILK